jgi:peptidylprolyl isomerase
MAVAVAMACAGCGSSGVPANAANASGHLATHIRGTSVPPKVVVPPGPPPDHAIVRRLKKGFGAVVQGNEHLGVQFVGAGYKTRKPFEVRWGESEPVFINTHSPLMLKGWKIGLRGMRVGEQREFILPARLAYGTDAVVYVVELVSIEKPKP